MRGEVHMLQWALTHPWMTFFLLMFLLAVLESVVNNITRTIIAKMTLREIEIKAQYGILSKDLTIGIDDDKEGD